MKSRIYFFWLLVLMNSDFFSQSAEWTWAAGSEQSSNTHLAGMASDADGNTYASGGFTSPSVTFGSYTLTHKHYSALAGNSDIFLASMNSTGEFSWAKSFTGNEQYVEAITVDRNGGVYITGSFQNNIVFDSVVLTGSLYSNSFLARFDQGGNLVWAKVISTTYMRTSGITCDKNGDVCLLGYFYSDTLTFGSIKLKNSSTGCMSDGCKDIFVAKFGSDGNIIWATSGGGPGTDWPSKICSDKFGNFFITGSYVSAPFVAGNCTLQHSPTSTFHLFVVKLDSAGNFKWAKTDDAAESVHGVAVAADFNGNLFLSGYFAASTRFDSLTLNYKGVNCYGDNPCYHTFLVKFDVSGTAVWARAGTGDRYDINSANSVDPEGNVYLTGKFEGPSVNFGSTETMNSNPWYGDDIYVTKFNSGGENIWTKSAGGSGDERATSIQAVDDFVIVGGNFESYRINFDTLKLYNGWSNQNNVFAARLDNKSTGISEAKLNETLIYPNPSVGIFHFHFRKKISGKVYIKDLIGNGIYSESFSSDLIHLDLSGFPHGLYFAEIYSGGNRSVRKIIIE
jgi:hypothetical protein